MASYVQVSVQGSWIPGWTAFAAEVWQYGYKTAVPAGMATDADTQACADYLAEDETFTGAVEDLLTASATADIVKVALVDDDGHYLVEPGVAALTITGSVAGTNQIAQAATVITTVATSVLRGKGRYGRFYIPLQPALTNGEINGTSRGTLLTAAGSLLESGSAFSGAGLSDVAVIHHRAGSSNTIVDLLRIGSIVDTQRRRRNRAVETYTEAAYPAA